MLAAPHDPFEFSETHPLASEHTRIRQIYEQPRAFELDFDFRRTLPWTALFGDGPVRLLSAILERIQAWPTPKLDPANRGYYHCLKFLLLHLVAGKVRHVAEPKLWNPWFEALADQSRYWLPDTFVAQWDRLAEAFADTARSDPEACATLGFLASYHANPENRTFARHQWIEVDPSYRPGDELRLRWHAPFQTSEALRTLLIHASENTGTSPKKKWQTRMLEVLAAIPVADLGSAFSAWVTEIERLPSSVEPAHAEALRGLAFALALSETPEKTAKLGQLLRACAHKLPGIGPRSVKGFGGALWGLEQTGSFEALAELSVSKSKVRLPSLREQIESRLEASAAQQGWTLSELEERIVPTYDFDVAGIRRQTLGEYEIRHELRGGEDVVLRWFVGAKEVKQPPAALKSDNPEEVKDATVLKRDIQRVLSAQKQRLEGLFLDRRWIPVAEWREHYLDHPLVSALVRRLIWQFRSPDGDRLGMPRDGELQDIEANPLTLDDETTVRLWHPLAAGASAIEAWREYLFQHEITQPFKQAFREIYLLTDAERQTNTYSNRFAAHILRQHQAVALMKTRGWRAQLQGFFDNLHDAPTRHLREWGLQAQFFLHVLDGIGDDMTDAGIALYVSSDQVRFLERGNVLPLEQIPAIVLSEILRDVDLFVGVTSVAADPTWQDRGDQPTRTYWAQVAFGELTVGAETRKAVLSRLLPRLKIAKVASIQGRFLRVEGKLRTYKIHLGSGNILMEPNDQYLCIVPAPHAKTEKKVFLPFEGDSILDVILSKALMLANDDRITEGAIVSQIRT